MIVRRASCSLGSIKSRCVDYRRYCCYLRFQALNRRVLRHEQATRAKRHAYFALSYKLLHISAGVYHSRGGSCSLSYFLLNQTSLERGYESNVPLESFLFPMRATNHSRSLFFSSVSVFPRNQRKPRSGFEYKARVTLYLTIWTRNPGRNAYQGRSLEPPAGSLSLSFSKSEVN